jgi:hypothetical protein
VARRSAAMTRRAQRQVGDEVTVHDIDVDKVGRGALDGLDFFGEPAKVSREDGGSNADVVHGRGA